MGNAGGKRVGYEETAFLEVNLGFSASTVAFQGGQR